MSNKFILKISHCNINMDAYRELKLNGDRYMFLDIINQYQNIPEARGWATPYVGNWLTTKTGLKYHIGRMLDFSDSGTDKLYKSLVKRGLIEDSVCGHKFAVTMDFFVLKTSGKRLEQHETDRKQQEKAETVTKNVEVLKFAYNETEFYENFVLYRNEVEKQVKNLPTNTDFKHYYDEFRRFYTSENLSSYTIEGWRAKIKTWITQDRQKGKLRVVDEKMMFSEMTDNQLITEIDAYKKMVSFPDEFTKYTTYRENALSFCDLVEKAEKAEILNNEYGAKMIDYKNGLQEMIQQRGQLATFLQIRKVETAKKQAETGENTQKTVVNTEGVKIDISKLAKQMKV